MATGALLLLGSGLASAEPTTIAARPATTAAVAAPAAVEVTVPVAAPAQGTVNSTFNFCNNTGGRIACFSAHLHYVNLTHFQLSNVVLKDTLADQRSVYADVYTQAGKIGTTFANHNGVGSQRSWKGPINYSRVGGVTYVHIKLWASNNVFPPSTAAWSKLHYNPYF
jgi:hypothetical protein